MGVALLVSEILLLSKMEKFSLQTIDYSPGVKKFLNQLKKIMQVEADVKCMHTNLGGCGFIGFGDIATFKKSQNFPSDLGL